MSTLSKWHAAERSPASPRQAAVSKKATVKKEGLADRIESLAHSILDAIPDKLGAASAKDLTTSLGIAVDKARLLRGESTAITESKDAGAKERVAERINRIAKAQRN